MLECKCLKNLTGFFIAKPPFVIFVLCLGTFAVGLVSLGLYVITHDFLETDPSKVGTQFAAQFGFSSFTYWIFRADLLGVG